MLDQDELKWIAATSTELNSQLQQVARYTDLVQRHKGEHGYIETLTERVEAATRTAQALFDRVTANIMQGTAARTAAATGIPVPGIAVMPAPSSEKAGAAKGKETEKAPEPVSSEIPPEIKVKNPSGNREYILLIDDEPEIAELASEMLAEEGYKVIVARDGFEALKIYQQINRQIGLVILDFFLPVMDGDAVFEELKVLNPSVNVVLSSGFAEQNKIGAMLAQGLRGFIPKPYTREKLLEQVRSTLEAARRPMR
ncbi:MAG: response regulator [Verrucomicrobiota bacterium]|nr:response regulator [Verrucomicrobiota bacterium]